MKFMILKAMIVYSSIIPFLYNPMSMGIMLLISTISMILLINKMMMSSWFSMITFLMMIGGLLIIFTYMSSIASNEKFKLNIKIIFMMIVIMTLSEDMLNSNQTEETENLLMLNDVETMSMMKLYNTKSMLLTMMLVIYLLLTMIIVSMIVKHNKGPLRSKM
uniref:NADH dehydrogenase subunit 6 n=1 Tax=Concaveplana rufolineata TaxID=2840404 RepID=A0A8E8GS87_9HEMI|nr:NADH dehydrogenase subunit 6 [Concaveplana rufolineata]